MSKSVRYTLRGKFGGQWVVLDRNGTNHPYSTRDLARLAVHEGNLGRPLPKNDPKLTSKVVKVGASKKSAPKAQSPLQALVQRFTSDLMSVLSNHVDNVCKEMTLSKAS